MILHVTGGEYAFNAGCGGIAIQTTVGFDVAIFHVQLTGENVGVRFVADGDEYAVDFDFFGRVAFKGFQTRAGYAGCVAQNFVQNLFGFECDFAFFHFFHHAVYQNRFGAEGVTAVNHGDMAGDIGQV